ncbi:MAG: hypothetical protein RIS85_312 [Pseudomonadota bacterium]
MGDDANTGGHSEDHIADLARRTLLAAPLALMLPAQAFAQTDRQGTTEAFAFISRITPKPGMADEYARIVERRAPLAPGCLFFSVARDQAQPNTFWTIEFWQDQATYQAAMQLPAFKDTIASVIPLVENYERIGTISPTRID